MRIGTYRRFTSAAKYATLCLALVCALPTSTTASATGVATTAPIPKIHAVTSAIRFKGRRDLLVKSLEIYGIAGLKLQVSCKRCKRFRGKIHESRPAPGTKLFQDLNWILQPGLVVSVAVFHTGQVGRYLLLAARTGSRPGLVVKTSGCLASLVHLRQCPQGTSLPHSGTPLPQAPPAPLAPSDRSSFIPAAQVAAGDEYACALLSSGSIYCWGENSDGQLGDGTTTSSSPTPVPVTGITDATAVTTGVQHSCALLSGGGVECWGENNNGELGNGTTTSSPTPVPVSAITNATAVAAGWNHSCALLSGGSVECWGENNNGELGNGTTTGSSTPVPVSGITNATAVAAGDRLSCALLAGGAVDCWGGFTADDLGDGTTTSSPTPLPVSAITDATAIGTGTDESCALLSGGAIDCWGASGWLGDGTTTGSPTPVAASGITDATAVAVGLVHVSLVDTHACALLSGGSVDCWGANGAGELGNGTITASSSPVPVSGITNATAIAAGGTQSCAILTGGTIDCWGLNLAGQLGDGETSGPENCGSSTSAVACSRAPAEVTGLP